MRNRYLDLLRAAAIVRVILYHLFGWPWLSIVLPAMGIMFALAGSLAAASLDRRAARRVVTSRLRRLLPPLWLLGLIAVPVMLALGWRHEVDGDHPFSIPRLAFWLLPLGDPPGSDKGVDIWEPLWYIRAYVWFILLSPVLYLVYRRIGWPAVVAPLVLMAALDRTGFALPDTADAAMWDFVTYGACWIAGFAHHDGRLARLRPWLVIVVAAVLGAAALYWLRDHQGEDAWDLNDVSESQALWSLAFVLLALRWQPSMRWLGRARPLDRAVTLLNARAVTIYLWHNIAIALVWPVLTVLTLDDLGLLEGPVDLLVALLLTGVAVLAFGWAEDLAARRRPRLWPSGGPAAHPVAVAEERTSVPALVGAPGPAEPPAPGDGPGGPGAPRTTLSGADAPAGATRSGVSAALRGRTGAAAALSRLPAAQTPAPRSGDDESAIARVMAAGRHQSGDVGSGTRDLGLPVAGRRADPVDDPDLTTDGTGSAGSPAAAPSGTVSPLEDDPDAEVWEGEIWDGEGTGTWAATGPVLGTPSEFGWTAAPGEPHGSERPGHGDGRPDWFRQRRENPGRED